MTFGVVGDVHGDFDALASAMRRHPDAAFWLSVGDVASEDMRYPEPGAPLYWIQGNNEDFDLIERLVGARHAVPLRESDAVPPREGAVRAGEGGDSLHLLPNGTVTLVDGISVAALGGTFAPTWYQTPAAELPYPGAAEAALYRNDARTAVASRPPVGHGFSRAKVRDDKRRHFVQEQVEALKAARNVDVLLTHEAARPFIVQAGPRRLDAGKTVINELLAAMHPRLHFFGHHHRFSDAVRDGVRSIGLDLVSRSYVLVDGASWEVVKVDAGA